MDMTYKVDQEGKQVEKGLNPLRKYYNFVSGRRIKIVYGKTVVLPLSLK